LKQNSFKTIKSLKSSAANESSLKTKSRQTRSYAS